MASTNRIAAPEGQAHNLQFALPSRPIARVLHQIRVMQQPSRAVLAKTLGYSQPSVTRYVSTLIDAGLVRTHVEPYCDIRAGRPAEQLLADGHHLLVWGFHIGARNTEVVISDAAGRILRSQSIPLRIIKYSVADALGKICQEAHKLSRGLPHPVTVGIAFSEHVDRNGSVTSSVYGWDSVVPGDVVADILGKPVSVATGVAAMAGSELANTPLEGGSLLGASQGNESTLYFYAREVIAHAWVFHGAVHRPHSGVSPKIFAQIAQSGTFQAEEGIHPLGNSAIINAARACRIPAKNLAHLVEISKSNITARALLNERAELLGQIIRLAVDVVDPKAIVFAGDAFTADPQGVQLIAQQLRCDTTNPSELRIQRASKSIVRDAARMVAVHQLWQNPVANSISMGGTN